MLWLRVLKGMAVIHRVIMVVFMVRGERTWWVFVVKVDGCCGFWQVAPCGIACPRDSINWDFN